jgi:dipeptidyl-peptidase-3
VKRDGNTYYNINDYDRLREIFGELLRETQRIKSEGDFQAAQDLVEGYGVKVDQEIHAEILKRNEKFTAAAYGGFVNPELVPRTDMSNKVYDIQVKYVNSFEYQMMKYAKDYGFLVED